MKPLLLPALAAAVALCAGAAAASTPSLVITDGWSRPAVAGTNGVGYITIVNKGARPETLVKVETPVAERVEMHSMSMAGNVMKMGQVSTLAVPAGGKIDFEPGGYHLMLFGLKKPLNIGDKVPVTFAFAGGAQVKTTLVVGVMPPTM
jgi:copper(I)-binding protein